MQHTNLSWSSFIDNFHRVHNTRRLSRDCRIVCNQRVAVRPRNRRVPNVDFLQSDFRQIRFHG